MDPPTHALIGRLAARTKWPERAQGRLVNYTMGMALLPDIDSFFSGDGVTYLEAHRGWTHSLPGIAVLGLAAAVLAKRFLFRGLTLAHVYAISVAGLFVHVLFDVVTSYGTQVFAPFSDYRAAFDLVFIIDPYFDACLIGALLLGRYRDTRWYRYGAAVTCCYLALNGALMAKGFSDLHAWADKAEITVDRAAVFPMPFSPWHRRGFVESGSRTYRVPLTGTGVSDADPVLAYDRALEAPDLAPAWKTRAGSAYAWFARYPVITERTPDRVLVEDLQFRIEDRNLGWLGRAATDLLIDVNPDFLERRIFYVEVASPGSAHPEVVFRRSDGD